MQEREANAWVKQEKERQMANKVATVAVSETKKFANHDRYLTAKD